MVKSLYRNGVDFNRSLLLLLWALFELVLSFLFDFFDPLSSLSSPSSCYHFAPEGGLGLTLESVFTCNLFKRGDRIGYTRSTLLPQQLLGRAVALAIESVFH